MTGNVIKFKSRAIRTEDLVYAMVAKLTDAMCTADFGHRACMLLMIMNEIIEMVEVDILSSFDVCQIFIDLPEGVHLYSEDYDQLWAIAHNIATHLEKKGLVADHIRQIVAPWTPKPVFGLTHPKPDGKVEEVSIGNVVSLAAVRSKRGLK